MLITGFVSSVGVVDLLDCRLPVCVWGTNHVTAFINSHNAFSNKSLF